MRAIHIASFGGNIGDILNHNGFYKTIGKDIGLDQVTQIEIRRFYKNALPSEKLSFSDDLLNEINTYDILILGGGGFFDLRWSYSHTGTTLDLSQDFIDGIKIPVIVNAMGYHEFFRDTSLDNCKAFGQFITTILNNGWFLSFRNDGSTARFRKRFGNLGNNYLLTVPDNGFFAIDKNQLSAIGIKRKEKVIGFCITNDLFCGEYNGNLSINEFNHQITDIIALLSERYQIVLFPHTPDDVATIGSLFRELPSRSKRYNIVIAPYNSNGSDSIFELARYYNSCDLIVGMRFHSLIMGLQLGCPTIALAGHQQIEDFYCEIGLTDYYIRLDSRDFSCYLLNSITEILNNAISITNQIENLNHKMKDLNRKYAHSLIQFLTQNNILSL